MKTIIFALLVLINFNTSAQTNTTQNIFIITADGLRWQEVFNGADSSIINNPHFVKDTALIKQQYWDELPEEKRKKLMPFFWNVLAKQGQLYGNRTFDNKVNVKNIYKISYPGYNEMLTGYADPLPVLNTPTYNKNISVLEYLNNEPAYKNKVAAFSSWNVFPFIFNSKRNTMKMNSGYELLSNEISDSADMINQVQANSIVHKTHTRYDLLTYMAAKEYIQNNHPHVVFISLGETDEFAHQGKYDMYLQQVNNFDKMIAELWYYVQTDPFYKNNTTFIITTDHGRGKKPAKWYTHNSFVKGSGEIWLGLLGQGIEPEGEMKTQQQIFQKQIAATVALLLGENFKPSYKTAEAIDLPQVKIKTMASNSLPEIINKNQGMDNK